MEETHRKDAPPHRGKDMDMEIFQTRLIKAMKESGIRATDLAERTGLSKARISQYVNGRYVPKSDAILRLAEVLGVSPLWLMGENVSSAESASLPHNLEPLRLRRYPMLGEIACGTPILANEDRDGGYITAADANADFCLTAKGDSMVDARIYDGDVVFIQQTTMVENGEIAAVVVDDDEATLKRVFYFPEEERLILKAENAAYEPMVFEGDELAHIHILGRAVAFQARVQRITHL